ncbi:MAG: PucR family transcriptional regulator [Dactylosporangium sp.]|nr:helix-turn-helix domain-containing protein [Dactylosporangium sp.]NNJ62568.1 PucR family transcriptional regulator [Dactylosporangium sp.]
MAPTALERPSVPGRYADLLAIAARTGQAPAKADLVLMRAEGERAADRRIGPRAIVDAYLRELNRCWARLPEVADAPTAQARATSAASVLVAARRMLDSVIEGYERARHADGGREASVRQQFIDDLLGGGGDPTTLAERAERFGVLLGGGHVVTVAQRPDSFATAGSVARRIETALVGRFGSRNVLLTLRDGLLVCVTPNTLRGVPGELAHQLVSVLGSEGSWRIGVGRQHSGASGVLHSYEEARNALHVAERLGLRVPVLHAADLLVFPVLLRDRAAITDLITTVLGPLATARGGPEPLLATLSAFFGNQGNTTATARQLGVSVRAVGYRLDRVERLTGYAATEPTQRFTLEAAVLGARLLDWPAQPLPGG